MEYFSSNISNMATDMSVGLQNYLEVKINYWENAYEK